MGLLSIIRKIKRKEKGMRILMVGLDNSGKTTIVLKINGEDTSVISPTLGFNIKTITFNKYTLNIWDVGGQRTIRSYWRNYFEQTDGLVWVVDSSDLRRLDDCKFELHNQLKEEVFSSLVKKCKKYGRAMRIGTKHGSLSDCIMSYYGDSTLGMVESTFEFARICWAGDTRTPLQITSS